MCVFGISIAVLFMFLAQIVGDEDFNPLTLQFTCFVTKKPTRARIYTSYYTPFIAYNYAFGSLSKHGLKYLGVNHYCGFLSHKYGKKMNRLRWWRYVLKTMTKIIPGVNQAHVPCLAQGILLEWLKQ